MSGKPIKKGRHGPARGLIVAAAVSLLALLPLGCGGPIRGLAGTAKVAGSTTVLPISQEGATEFMELNPRAKIQVQGGGSSVGITQLIEGVVDIANSSRTLKGGEDDKGLVDYKIAFDIIVIVVNPGVPVDSLTAKQVKDIFTGKITNWKSIDGRDKEIVVVVRDQASGTREMFDQKALGSTADHPVESVASAIECASNGVVRETVGTTPNSLGYISYGYVNKLVKPVQYDRVPPDLPNAASGRYPMARYLHMFTKGEAKGVAKAYIDFILSDKFQNEVVALEYVPVRKVTEVIR